MTSANEDIKLPRHGEASSEAVKSSLLPRGVKAIYVSERLFFLRWGIRGWSQLSEKDDRELRDRLGLE